jgi:hypothetical protein
LTTYNPFPSVREKEDRTPEAKVLSFSSRTLLSLGRVGAAFLKLAEGCRRYWK